MIEKPLKNRHFPSFLPIFRISAENQVSHGVNKTGYFSGQLEKFQIFLGTLPFCPIIREDKTEKTKKIRLFLGTSPFCRIIHVSKNKAKKKIKPIGGQYERHSRGMGQ
jgi:hypothetical protein